MYVAVNLNLSHASPSASPAAYINVTFIFDTAYFFYFRVIPSDG
ncbi:hypothetical protein LM801457_100538 [Listeria monocytogenes]|nr:hypothetical protein LM801457_100538 [Listeria monocytogenes]